MIKLNLKTIIIKKLYHYTMKLNTIINVAFGGYAFYLGFSAVKFIYTFKPVSDRVKNKVYEISENLIFTLETSISPKCLLDLFQLDYLG